MTSSMLDFMGGSWQSFAIDGSVYAASGSAYEMDTEYAWNRVRIWRWTPSNADAHVKLPHAPTWNIPEGGPMFYMENLDAATYGIHLHNQAGLAIGEIGPQNSASYNKCIIFLVDATNDIWKAFGVRSDGSSSLLLLP